MLHSLKISLEKLVALTLSVCMIMVLAMPIPNYTISVHASTTLTENDVVSWMNSSNGTTITDGGTQCVAAFNSYLRLFGITNPIGQYPVSGAKQIFDYNAPSGWQKISGSGNYRVGDIVIWNGNVGGGWGHVGMVYSTSENIEIFDQNWVSKSKCGIHNISNEGSIRGVFRPPLSGGDEWKEESGWDLSGSFYPVNTTSNTPVYYFQGGEEANRYIEPGDECYIDKVYISSKTGTRFVHVCYPTSSGDRWSYARFDSFQINKNPVNAPSNVSLSINKSNFFFGDTVTLTPTGDNVTDYYIAIRNIDGDIVHDADKITGAYSISADTFQCGVYTVWVSAKNSAGSTDSNHITFSVNIGLNLGDDFTALIINADKDANPWKPILQNDSQNVELGSELRTNFGNTLWHFVRNSDDGTYTIWSYKNGLVMEADGSENDNAEGVNIQCFESNGGANQRWYLVRREDGTIRLKPKCSRKVLDIADDSTEDGANVTLRWSDDSVGQCFSIYLLNKDRDKLDYTIAAENTKVTMFEKVKISITGRTPYAYNYKMHIIDPEGNETVENNRQNPVYTFTALKEGVYTIYAEVKNPLYTEVGSAENKSVKITVTPQIVKGDCNHDGKIGVLDVVMLQKWLLNDGTKLTDWKAADLYEDGVIDVFDLCMMKRALIG